MVFYKTAEEIELIRESSLLVSQTHVEVCKYLEPGVKTSKLDQIAEEFIRDNKGVPAFKGYNGFPATLCISINEEVVHGIPGDREIKSGDVVSVDCGVKMNGFFGDSAFTYPIGEVSSEALLLLKHTNESLYKGIEMAIHGNRLEDIGFAVQNQTEKQYGYGVVRELVGHGIGKSLHEEPSVANYGKRGRGMKLQEGLVIAIEPMINLGTAKVKFLSDGWTVVTADGKPSAHFEHTIAVKKNRADILSNHDIIFESIKKNNNIVDFR
jgi:methionyl aminopeptidase